MKRFLALVLSVAVFVSSVQVYAVDAITTNTLSFFDDAVTVSVPAVVNLNEGDTDYSAQPNINVTYDDGAESLYTVTMDIDETVTYNNDVSSLTGTISPSQITWSAEDLLSGQLTKVLNISVNKDDVSFGEWQADPIDYTITVKEVQFYNDIEYFDDYDTDRYFNYSIDEASDTYTIVGLTDLGVTWYKSTQTTTSKPDEPNLKTYNKRAYELVVPSKVRYHNVIKNVTLSARVLGIYNVLSDVRIARFLDTDNSNSV